MLKKIVRKAWVLQPRWLRRIELRTLEMIVSRPIQKSRTIQRGDVVVCGFMGTASGLGQSARQILRQLQDGGYDTKSSNFSQYAVLDDFKAGPLWPEKTSQGGALVVCVNPDIFHLVYMALGRRRMTNRRIIGLWYWELETFPDQWVRCLNCVDEVWAGSEFVARGLRKVSGNVPVHVVLPPLDVEAIPTTPRNDPFPQYAGRTIVFFMYDVRSVHARKNPDAVVKAFLKATAGDPNPVLIIKINNGGAWPQTLEILEAAAGNNPNIVLMQERLTPDAMHDLMARVDIIMSLHRSEGFGLLMAEGMAAAKPVIATGWSANTDFMDNSCSVLIDYKLVPVVDPQNIYDRFDAHWAEPNIDHAARALRDLLDHPEKRIAMGLAARQKISAYLSKDAWLNNLSSSFRDVLKNPPRT